MPYTAIILDGQAEITIKGKPLNLTESEMVIMPANKPHSVGGSKEVPRCY